MIKNENYTIGDRIRRIRKQRKLTLDDLAIKTGVTKQTIQRYEVGDIANIPYNKMKIISEILSVSPSYIAGWEESPIQDKYNQLTHEQKKIIDLLLDEFTK